MNYEENPNNKTFEQSISHLEDGERVAAIALQIGSVALALCKIPRKPIICHKGGIKGEITQGTVREDDAQHSFMLGMLAKELISDPMLGEHFDHLSEIEAARYSDVHDMSEIVTGDTATYNLSLQERAEKEEKEQLAIDWMSQRLPSGQSADLKEYHKQERPTARFVRHVDKLLPLVVDVLGEGSDVIREDYKVKSIDEHNKKSNENREHLRVLFPEDERGHKALHEAWDILAGMVAAQLEESFESDLLLQEEPEKHLG